jgi:hypothetical protein
MNFFRVRTMKVLEQVGIEQNVGAKHGVIDTGIESQSNV